ncbi:helix-turn-helix transcriptional regulator [Filimonas effusa]|uniref:AraC family transcriptional regulator n=1 Tax=Filimonas effusa TaxID=2508721 RepID=A0A4Q1D762_9BACT|nr:helix-turn-helix transcriptional regulator [Filimonas effusa]RXK83517.1 AraC family transcriptional regulator [Filimonas effusa]
MYLVVKLFRVVGTSLLLILALALFQVAWYIAAITMAPGNDLIKIESPLFFLHGPLLYFLYLTAAGVKRPVRKKALHFIPFGCMLLGAALLLSKSVLQHAGLQTAMIWYNQLSGLAGISLFVYLITISLSNRRQRMLHPSLQRFLGQVTVIYVFVAIMQLAGIAQLCWPALQLDVNTQGGQYALLVVVALFAIREIAAIKTLPEENLHQQIYDSRNIATGPEKQQLPEDQGAGSRYRRSTLDETTLHSYAVKVQCFLEESRCFLDPDLSQEKLAAETGIPRHHLSQLLSVFFVNSFYQFIAGHRIVYAMQLLKNSRENYTLESFAQACGFHSKSTFNKYFKEYVGCTPSEYRVKMTAARNIKNRIAADA